ncbi:MAG TPA: hypothetical protein DCM87_19270 [Planctomycetes bacterium]|nr:hypothetical protein [Planctomycetota bacterium]
MESSTRDSVPVLVSGTAIEFSGGRLTCSTHGDMTVLSAEGLCSVALLGQIEQYARRTNGTLGLDFAALRNITPLIVPMLERVRIALAKRDLRLVLIAPPAQLKDILDLHGLEERYFAGEMQPAPKRRAASACDVTQFARVLRDSATIERGLETAEARISSFMPQALPTLSGWRFGAYWRACDRIGGDFYDFVPLGTTRVGIAVGDVSGHGIAAAMLMGIAKKVLRLRAKEMVDAGPASVLARVNGDLLPDLQRGAFVTILYGVLDAASGEFTFARAGHEPPLRVSPHAAVPEVLMTRGAAVGILRPDQFAACIEERSLALRPGEGIVLLSDGICDSADERSVRFGRARIAGALAGADPSRAVKALLEALSSFVCREPPRDDMTVVAFARTAA